MKKKKTAYELLADFARERGLLEEYNEELDGLKHGKIHSLPIEVLKQLPEAISEERAASIMSKFLGVPLSCKQNLEICGKTKNFDFVNLERRVVGDLKSFYYKGTPSAQKDNITSYVWLMEKLEKHTGTKWRKFILGNGNRKTFEDYAKEYDSLLGDLEIYFIDDGVKVQRIR